MTNHEPQFFSQPSLARPRPADTRISPIFAHSLQQYPSTRQERVTDPPLTWTADTRKVRPRLCSCWIPSCWSCMISARLIPPFAACKRASRARSSSHWTEWDPTRAVIVRATPSRVVWPQRRREFHRPVPLEPGW